MAAVPHIEHHNVPSLETLISDDSDTKCSTFRLTRDQVDALKRRCEPNRTTFEVVAGHVWRCTIAMRGLAEDQQMRLQQLSMDTRWWLRPPLPPGFIGNGIFFTAALATCRRVSRWGKVSEAIARVDYQFVRSASDYVELLHKGGSGGSDIVGGERCPNLGIGSWLQLPFHKADFGWGKPEYLGPGATPLEGKASLCVDPENEGDLMLARNHINRFHNLLYHHHSTHFTITSKI